jgi:beta-lactamase regulating signal transducer with metallopeptidase domain
MTHSIHLLWMFLVNSVCQIALVASVVAVIHRRLSKLRPQTQYRCYMCSLAFALILPFMNMAFHEMPPMTRVSVLRNSSQLARFAVPVHQFSWRGSSVPVWEERAPTALMALAVVVWTTLTLLGLIRLLAGLYGIQRLRRNSATMPASTAYSICQKRLWAGSDVAILLSDSINGPFTAGYWKPAIFMPTDVVAQFSSQHCRAMFLHEWMHIARRDFAWHIACEFSSLPFWWHPGVRFFRSQISQTRELACDEQAAASFGDRNEYAQVLLTLAKRSVISGTPDLVGVCLLQEENLERRITMLLQKTVRPSFRAVVVTIVAMVTLLGSTAMLAHAFAFESAQSVTAQGDRFAGKWVLQYEGEAFATLILVPSDSGYSGSMTNGDVQISSEGHIISAKAHSGSSKIASTQQSGSALVINVHDGDDTFTWKLVLKDATHAELTPVIPGFDKVESFPANRVD